MARGHFLRSCSVPLGVSCRTKPGDGGGRRRSKSLAQRIFFAKLIAGAYIFFSITCRSQEESQGKEPPDRSKTANQAEQSTTPAPAKTQPEKEAKRAPRGAFVAVPIPISSPAIGTGIVPAAGYAFPFSTKDKVSSPSVVGDGGLRFLLSRPYHVNLCMDYGICRDGHTFGMSIGEAF